MPDKTAAVPSNPEPNPRNWCGYLLAYARGQEIECNRTKGHPDDKAGHRHFYGNGEED